MVDQFTFTLNVLITAYAFVTSIIFWFTWRKRPDLRYWFIALIIYSISHIFLTFKQDVDSFVYIGNGIQVAALLIVIISSFAEYYLLMFKSTNDKQAVKKEKIILILTFSLSILASVLSGILLHFFLFLDLLGIIVLVMVALLIIISIIVLRIYIKQKTITRLFIFFTFFVGTITAISTLLAGYISWGNPLNYGLNFIFISIIITVGFAAPIEQRITDSEDKYRILSLHLEEEVAERTIQLEEALEELESFSYSVSHDLKSPLRSIQGFSQALLQDFSNNLDAEGKDFLERIIKNSDRMDDLITDLFELSNTLRYTEYDIKPVDMSNLADEILKDLLLLYPDHKVEFHIQENMNIDSDPKLIRIILENLFGNALKFSTPKSNPKIEFGTIDQNDTTVFFVRDYGVGFDMKYIDKLFRVFQRLHSIEEFDGSGIGLATVKRIVQKLDGKIWAEGETNKGATFYFTINQK